MRLVRLIVVAGFITGLGIVVGGCESETDNGWDLASVRNAIEESNRLFGEAFGKGDAAGVAARYTSSGKLLPPNAEPVIGREDIQAFWQTAIDGGAGGATLQVVEIELKDDAAMEIGEFSITAGDTVVDNGKYVVIWFLEDDKWKMHVDIWNSSRPAPGA